MESMLNKIVNTLKGDFSFSKISKKSFKIFLVCFIVLLISSCVIILFINMYITGARVKLPVRLGMGFFVDGYYINRNRLDAMWMAENFYMNNDGSFAITLTANYTASESSSVIDAEYVGSGFLMIADAVYDSSLYEGVYRQYLSGLIPVIANSTNSRSCIIEYQGKF